MSGHRLGAEILTSALLATPSATQSGAAALRDVPEHQRHRLLSGMRWSVWLSALAVPFSLGTNLLLARVGPETIGVYGLLSVYVTLTSSFIYFGGDTVVMRFIPECSPDNRASFLVSYLLIISGLLGFWLVFAHFCPAALRLVLGKTGGDQFHFLILLLAPVPIAFAMVVASLKAMLDIRFSQLLAKLLAIVSLPAYAAIFLMARPLLIIHPTAIVWSLYLGTMAVLGIIGAIRLVRLCGAARLRFYLPDGFWRYAFATQQVSAISFLTSRIDYVLILNFGGLGLLGRYVALMSVAATVPMMSGLFMDTLLPSLTNMIAARNHDGAAQIFMLHMRIMFLVTMAMSCAIMLLAVPATAVLGPKYHSLAGLIILTVMFFGIANPGAYGGTLLATVSRQQLAVWTGALQLLVFTGLFFVLWHRWNLTGAVVADGLALLISNATLMTTALLATRIYPSIIGLWVKAAVIQASVCVSALWWMPLEPVAAMLVWLGAMVLFLLLAGYGVTECKSLAQTFLPAFALGLRKSWAVSASEPVKSRAMSG